MKMDVQKYVWTDKWNLSPFYNLHYFISYRGRCPKDKERIDNCARQICVTTVVMVAMTRGIAYSFGEFLRELENEFCEENCEARLGWIESISIGNRGNLT